MKNTTNSQARVTVRVEVGDSVIEHTSGPSLGMPLQPGNPAFNARMVRENAALAIEQALSGVVGMYGDIDTRESTPQ